MDTPVRPNALPPVSQVADADVLIVDGVDGLRRIRKDDFEAQLAGAPSSFNPTDVELKKIAANDGYIGKSDIQYHTGGEIESATVTWPDNSLGAYAAVINETFNTVDGFTVTHADSGKTVTQPTVTRDAEGKITNSPALTVT